MSLHTPRLRTKSSLAPTSAEVHRNASLNALTGTPGTPATKASMESGIAVGDTVNVPGDMYGSVKFIGSVRGKQGRFIGVELAPEFAARGKNDGDVDGIRYFDTSIAGAGIFLPVHRAEKRHSPTLSLPSFPGTPLTPSHPGLGLGLGPDAYASPTTNMPKFSQSLGPGARPPSPHFKPKSRPSLPRPESPFRKQPSLAPTPARNFSMSQRQPVPPRFTSSPAPPRSSTPRAATATTTSRAVAPTRPYSRSGSRLGNRADAPRPSTSSAATAANARRSPSRPVNVDQEAEIQRLVAQLQEKDKQLHEQATSLADMESSLKEIQELMPSDDTAPDGQDLDSILEMRLSLREKNDKIQSLISEFDAHRADFRSTIDTLELASAETERVYEAKVADLLAEIQELRELGNSREDVENVARQLKGLEELVAELEEGLEDARRGEAEARGEVEFLRGEVERGRSELRREREKAAKALQGAKEAEGSGNRDRDVEMKDDEIRGLKAIIHSLSSGPEVTSPLARQSPAPSRFADTEELKRTQDAVQQLEREKSELQGLIDRKAFREEELERAIEHLRRAAEEERNSIMNTPAEEIPLRTAMRSPEVVRSPQRYRAQQQDDDLWCEVCEAPGHEIPTCPRVGAHKAEDQNSAHKPSDGADDDEDLSRHLHSLDISTSGKDANHRDALEAPVPLSARKMSSNSDSHEKDHETNRAPLADVDADKWCALCEKDGHLAFDCPDEQY